MPNDNDYPKVIFHEEFDERSAYEAPLRGYVSHIIVETEDGNRYSVYFSDVVRLQQDLEIGVKHGEPCFAEPGLIVLPEVTVETIHEAVKYLWKQNFFSHLKAL
jgi:hypothetical protein